MIKKKKLLMTALVLGIVFSSSTLGYAQNLKHVSRTYTVNYRFYNNHNQRIYTYNWTRNSLPRNFTMGYIPIKVDKPVTNVPIKPSKPVVDKVIETPQAPDIQGSKELPQMEMEVVKLVNLERTKAGLLPFTASSELSKLARLKSEDMAKNNYFSHTSPKYGSPFEMMKSFNISYQTAGENIAKGYLNPQSVVRGWMDSQGHRENILNPNFKTLGLGLYTTENGTNYWTQIFTN